MCIFFLPQFSSFCYVEQLITLGSQGVSLQICISTVQSRGGKNGNSVSGW